MNAKNVVISLLVFVVIACVCPVCIAAVLFGLESLGNESLRDTFGILFLAGLCSVAVVPALGGAFWRLQHTFRSRVAGRRLAQAMGLQPLNQSTKQPAIWYGGEHQGRRFAIKPVGSTYRYYAQERSRIGVRFYLQIIMEVLVSEPMGATIYRGIKGASKNPQNFKEAFTLESVGRLAGTAQAAMFDFVQKGYPTGMSGLSFRFNKGTRNLSLRDRATVPPGMLAPEIWPDVSVILVHDHPDTGISPEQLRAFLDEMAAVARAIEESA